MIGLDGIYLVPYRWWPELLSREVPSGETKAEFRGLGGPFQKGLIAVAGASGPEPWQVAGAFDLDRSNDLTVSCAADQSHETSLMVPEAACVAPWRSDTSGARRLFFSMLTPTALFWGPATLPKSESVHTVDQGPKASSGVHGYARCPFLPVLIESADGGAWLKWTSDASEFELAGIPGGVYRVRALDAFGRVCFARGLVVPPSDTVDLETPLFEEIELDEPLDREAMGAVRWEDGRPAAGAEVFLQDATDFRRFLQRAVADRNGFFRVPNVPGDAQYFAFALPAKDDHAMKRLIYPRTDAVRRKAWLDLRLSSHKIVGRLGEGEIGREVRLNLVADEPKGRERVVWSVVPDKSGRFEITNVPHGHYFVRASGAGTSARAVSPPFAISGDLTVEVQWPRPRHSNQGAMQAR